MKKLILTVPALLLASCIGIAAAMFADLKEIEASRKKEEKEEEETKEDD